MTVRERLASVRQRPAPANEEATKFQIIVPVLDDLGWDAYNVRGTDEVRFEHPVGSNRAGGRVDIALIGIRDQCACLVEAKAPGTNFDDHVGQLLGYAFHEGVTLCVFD